MRVLGINAIFHDPAAALVVDGRTVAAAEEERFSRRKHGKRPVPFSAWDLPDQAAAWCLREAGMDELRLARVPFTQPPSIADEAAEVLSRNGIVAWFQGRAEYGLRALGPYAIRRSS